MRAALRAAWVCAALLPIWPLLAATGADRNPSAATFTVVFSGDMDGHITPCGCSQPMLGGMPRRAALLKQIERGGPLVKIENGDLTEGAGRQDEMKAETIVEMLNGLGYDAVNLGEKDFRLGVPFLLALQARFRGALLCAGATGADGKPLFRNSVVVTRTVGAKSVQVLVVGVLSPPSAAAAQSNSPGVRFAPTDTALTRLRAAILAHGGPRVLLFHGASDEAKTIARRFPWFDLVVYSHGGEGRGPGAKEGRAVFASGGELGKQIGIAEVGLDRARAVSVRYRDLGPSLADDMAIAAQKLAYLDRVAAEDLYGQMPRQPSPSGGSYVGSSACAGCHADAARTWQSSRHASATKTLGAIHEDADPECITCHAVGADRIGGFQGAAKTPHLTGVGCESCHGAGATHAKDPARGLGKAGLGVCTACHVPQHSPRFNADAYWRTIRH